MQREKNDKFIEELKETVKSEIYFDEELKRHTSFMIGGKAEVFIVVKNKLDLRNILKIAKKYNKKIHILGAGSNVLVSDLGVDGIVVKIAFDKISITARKSEAFKSDRETDVDYFLKAEAGALLSEVIKKGSENSLGSMARMYGIPGSVGGAVVMNAGAFNLEMKDVVYQTEYMDYDGNICKIDLDAHKFGYRHSVFKEIDGIILSSTFKLEKVDKVSELLLMDEIITKRETNQPLEYASAGSVFKRLDDGIASMMIDQSGLKGLCIGDAEVSKKHAGFIINKGCASAKDVKELIKKVQKKIKEDYNKDLQLEVILMGKEE